MADNRTVINGINWPDGSVIPIPGMYLGVQDLNTLQFFNLPPNTGVTSVGITGQNGILVDGGPITSAGDITLFLTDITPKSVSTFDASINGNLTLTGSPGLISADFSNINTSLRTVFQTRTLNERTVIAALPNGTNPRAAFSIANTETALDCAYSSFFISGTGTGIQTTIRGTGKYLPFIIITGPGLPGDDGLAGFMQDVGGNISLGGRLGLTTNATTRFLYINSMPGTPIGNPPQPMGQFVPQEGKTPITVDTTNNKVYFYTNSTWHNTNTPDYQEFTATAGQTVFNTQVRTLAKTGTKSFLQVFVNGLLQQEGAAKQYTVSGSTQIRFNSGITTGANVVIYGFS